MTEADTAARATKIIKIFILKVPKNSFIEGQAKDIRNQELVTTSAELVARIKELETSNNRIDGQKKEIETSNAGLNVRNQELEESEAANTQLAAQKKVHADLTVESDAKMKKLAVQMEKIKTSTSTSNSELNWTLNLKKVEDLNSELLTMKNFELETQLTRDIQGCKDKFGRILTAIEESQRDLDGIFSIGKDDDDLDKFFAFDYADEQI
ncbi:hypothetical protein Glove_444g10 [Diversispora epigaea]|uniref:Uncharacterized protein n=1 Tax=Diversispora epigaea TaxID=1348612 RepID=A0A397GQB9_9GLOM|nr:hypothetical protein Glove_444g10 [Diversispora epigaea]